MNCEECQSNLIDYLHHELDGSAREGVGRHLAACGDCALESCRLRADLEGISEAYEQAPRAEIRDALRRRVHEQFAAPWWRRTWRLWHRPVPAYGALLAALVPFVIWFAANAASASRTDQQIEPATPRIQNYDAADLIRVDGSVL